MMYSEMRKPLFRTAGIVLFWRAFSKRKQSFPAVSASQTCANIYQCLQLFLFRKPLASNVFTRKIPQEGVLSGKRTSRLVSVVRQTACKSTWQTKFKYATNKYFGYVTTVEEAMAVETTTKYSFFNADKMFGSGVCMIVI